MLRHINLLSFCFLSLFATVAGSQRYQSCEAFVDGERALARSSYEYFYEVVLDGRGVSPHAEVMFRVPVDPLPSAYGEQTFLFYNPNYTNERRTCNISAGRTCDVSYNYSLSIPENEDDILDTRIGQIQLFSKYSYVCFLSLEIARESHDIEATASWKRLSDSIYEVKANVTSGYPRPSITRLKCNDKEVNTTTTGSTADSLLVSDIEKLRSAHCTVTLSNRFSSKELTLNPLHLPPLLTTTTTPNQGSNNSNQLVSVIIGLVVLAVVLILIIVVIIVRKHKLTSNVNIVNQVHHASDSVHVNEETEDVESCTSIPKHQPPLPGPTMDNISANVSIDTSGLGDEVTEPSPNSSLELEPTRDGCIYPVAESGATVPISSNQDQTSLSERNSTSCCVAIASDGDDKTGVLDECKQTS